MNTLYTISAQDIRRRLRQDNPWWTPGRQVEKFYTRLPRRYFFDKFLALVQERGVRRAVVLMGARRVGKTVLLQHIIQQLLESGVPGNAICYCSLDVPFYAGLPLEKIQQFYFEETGQTPSDEYFIFFDEIQYLKDWEQHLKSLVDAFFQGKFVVSGSAAAALKRMSQESGAGRFTDFHLPSLLFSEYLRMRAADLFQDNADFLTTLAAIPTEILNQHFFDFINFGGYPEAAFNPAASDDAARYIKSDILEKVLLRDLPSLYGIQDVTELNRLMATIAYNTGNEVSLDALSQSSQVSKNTIKKYLEYLESAFLIRILHRVDDHGKAFKRVNFFKVYLSTPSLRAALFGPVGMEDPLAGLLVETALLHHLDAFYGMGHLRYARWRGGEVDFLVLGPNLRPILLIESKWSTSADDNLGPAKHLLTLASRFPDLDIGCRVFTRDTSGTTSASGRTIRYMHSAIMAFMYAASIEQIDLVKGNLPS